MERNSALSSPYFIDPDWGKEMMRPFEVKKSLMIPGVSPMAKPTRDV